MDYRSTARTHCQTAKALLLSGTDDEILLAALKLRMALESITDDRSKAMRGGTRTRGHENLAAQEANGADA